MRQTIYGWSGTAGVLAGGGLGGYGATAASGPPTEALAALGVGLMVVLAGALALFAAWRGRDDGDRRRRSSHAGFSFLELAIVLVVLGLVMGTGAQIVSLSTDYNQVKSTGNHLDEIEKALVSYAQRQRRLPCPDVNTDADGYDGLADPEGPGACTNDQGGGQVPYATLGISAEVGDRDGWGDRIVYRVYDGPMPLTASNALDMTACDPGDPRLYECDGPDPQYNPGGPLLDICDGDTADAAELDTNAYNDGCIGPSASDLDDDNNGNIDAQYDDNPGNFVHDRGFAIDDPGGTRQMSPADGTGAAYVLISYGADRVPGTPDLAGEAAQNANAIGTTFAAGPPYIETYGFDGRANNEDLLRYRTILNIANAASLGPTD